MFDDASYTFEIREIRSIEEGEKIMDGEPPAPAMTLVKVALCARDYVVGNHDILLQLRLPHDETVSIATLRLLARAEAEKFLREAVRLISQQPPGEE